MSFKRLLLLAIVLVLGIWAVKEVRSPYRVALPFGSTDLRPIESALARLTPVERKLAEGYVRRSRGDVLPPQFADPSDPLTARTVGEAITLQRRFLVQMAAEEARAEARRAARDEELAPLRAALSIALVRREVVPGDEAMQPSGSVKTARSSRNDREVLVTTWRLENTSRETIDSFKASVMVRKLHRDEAELGILDDCYLTRDEPLAPTERVEIRCANLNRGASSIDRDFVAMSEDDFVIDWEPRLIRFHNKPSLSAEN